MNSRLIKFAAVIALLCFVMAASALIWVNQNSQSQLIGNLVFAQAVEPSSKIKEIVVRTQQQTITLLPDNDFWHVKEADNYYANFDIIRTLFHNFKESRFIRRQTETPQLISDLSLANPYQNSAHAGISVSIIGEKGQEYNQLILGKRDNDNLVQFARIPSLPDIFTITGQFTLPEELSSWTQQPLLALETKDLQALKIGDAKVSRSDTTRPFIIFQNQHPVKLINLESLQRQIIYLNYEKVMSAQNFDDTLYPKHRHLELTTFNGLVYNLDILTDTQEYWLKLTLSTTALPTTETNDYIKNNAFLYDGWFFKLPDNTGRILYQYQL